MAYIDKHGVEYTDDKKILVRCPEDFGGAGIIDDDEHEYIIPDGVTEINSEAFRGCSRLTSVTIPNSVTNIGREAFRGCSRLTSVTIPSSVTKIEYGAFWGCSRLQEVLFIGGNIHIELDVFKYCPNLNSIDIPSNLHLDKGRWVEDAYNRPFTDIININYNGDNNYAPWGALALNGYKEGPLYFKDETKKILFGCEKNYKGEIVIPETVVEIGAHAFECCAEITDIILHENIIKIGHDNFTEIWRGDAFHPKCILYIPLGTYTKFKKMYSQGKDNYKELDMYGQKYCRIEKLNEGGVQSYKEVDKNGLTSFFFPEDTRRFFTSSYSSRTDQKEKIYFTGELQSLSLLGGTGHPDRVFYINNYIEDVDINYLGYYDYPNCPSLVKDANPNIKRYDEYLIFKAPLPNTKPVIGKIVELTYCGQNQNYRYTEYVWSTPIAINVDDIACIVETRLRCYEGMHSGCRIMLLGGKSDQLAKQELPCYVDVWEDYDFVLQKLLQAGWQR